jgi:GNAT superfamily N-acetyltransferase
VIVERATERDLDALLALMRAYCDFYGADPGDEDLLALAKALLADPAREGIQFLARAEPGGEPIGFATVFWSWSTLSAGRLAVMNDLSVSEAARGTGAAEALIGACARAARDHGARTLSWQTAKDNLRAQRVYERIGGQRSEWYDYELRV